MMAKDVTTHELPAIRTVLDVPAEPVFAELRHKAEDWDMPLRESGDTISVQMVGGRLTARSRPEGVQLSVEGDDDANLQMLRDFLTDQLALYGLSPVWTGARPRALPANLSLARIVSVARISPSYRRVTVSGADLARFGQGGLHFRLLFGPEGAAWPATDGNGVTVWPGGASAWHRPVYTTRAHWTEGGETRLSFDIFLHEGGRVTDWSAAARPGQEIALAGPSGDQGRKEAPWQGFVADETALPAVARMLARLAPDTRGQAVIVVPEAEDRQPLTHPEGVTLTWLARDRGADPVAALAAMDIPEGARHVFFAAEKAEALAARAALLDRGLAKSEFTAATYWIKGES
ncbi:siderophore-interacting protein [Celeribacter indicus]|uniref:Siderophore-interacting protein n=1 Tax=Celeribacter indicus TaxID=1208324 RepID=A0A0B5E625_9RHOB|nr:siderophore-interacting protein [Celeribacter indicus]AJE48860.1 siderophore-interacting protein [Celeribacter indicus]SDW39403.1 NADPH-dependent ferric siderophore reductase, contains FAD-binding and SIP domains [Celeribacter indicus]